MTSIGPYARHCTKPASVSKRVEPERRREQVEELGAQHRHAVGEDGPRGRCAARQLDEARALGVGDEEEDGPEADHPPPVEPERVPQHDAATGSRPAPE